MCQRRIYILCLPRYLVLFLFRLRAQRAHVVQAVGYLYQHYADVVRYRQQQLPEVLCLLARMLSEHTTGNLRQPRHDHRYLLPEQVLNILHRVVRIFHHIVQQRTADARAPQSYLLHAYTSHRQRVHHVWLAAQAAHAVVSLIGKMKCARNQLHFLSVHRMRIIIQQRLKLALNHLLFGLCKLTFFHGQHKIVRKITKNNLYVQGFAYFLRKILISANLK